ncbi:SGNH/GDSL hydrolase family protein [Aureimonas jatrophae]|uniref:SGNH hydrolase-type esterase domain-containing protein n=1 Tax=Aureimonas jatrophae TaxID=1166073 RepID=A0A1H0IHH2_9HYPH|nr:DUF459 domain-containing protein [Aureimonas jatrophae]MBB3952174.1 hypothetical protein [Aureimonas jatrophae]SDO30848.1 hypothetical protein SAMN05192530_105150 [Aureimonas jatrophae]
MAKHGIGSWRKATLSAAALLVALSAAVPEADAQQRRTLMDMLFGRDAPQADPRGSQAAPGRRAAPRPRAVRKKRRDAVAAPKSGTGRRNAATAAAGAAGGAAAVAAAAEPVEKSQTARNVLVIGDFMAGSLAKGLEDAVSGNREIRIIAKANGSSGLVRDDHYDWPASVAALIDETKASAVVVMVGANDRQGLRDAGETVPLRSKEWSALYTARAAALAEAVKSRNVPLIWVGMPAFQSERATEDMVYLNDLFRAAALKVGGEFVDVWGGFVSADGTYTTSGPDTAGQTVRLRNSDGITMTPAGQDKLAYYVEKPITKVLGLSVDDLVATLGAQQLGAGDLPTVGGTSQAALAVSTPPVSLSDPRLDGGEHLLGSEAATAGPQRNGGSPRDALVVNGGAIAAAEGRADNFSWTGRGTAVSPQTRGNAIVARGSISLEELRTGAPAASGPQPNTDADDAAKALRPSQPAIAP